MRFLIPELLKPLLAVAANPAPHEVHEQVTVMVAHVVAALDVGIKLALEVDADVISYALMLEHEVLDGVLLCADVVLDHEHCVVGHHLEGPAVERGAAEEGAADVDVLVILRDQEIEVFDAEVLGGVDVRGVVLELAVQDGCVAHQAALIASGPTNSLTRS